MALIASRNVYLFIVAFTLNLMYNLCFFHQLKNSNCRFELFACVVNELLALNEYLIPERCLPPPHFQLCVSRSVCLSLACSPYLCLALLRAFFVASTRHASAASCIRACERNERTHAAGKSAARRRLERLKIESRQGSAAIS